MKYAEGADGGEVPLKMEDEKGREWESVWLTWANWVSFNLKSIWLYKQSGFKLNDSRLEFKLLYPEFTGEDNQGSRFVNCVLG